MDILIVLISVAFIGLVSVFGYQFYEEHRNASGGLSNTPKNKVPKKDTHAEMLAQMRRKVSEYEERIKKIELEFEASKLELNHTKEREKKLLDEKSQNKFDGQQYEKFKKEYVGLKDEIKNKEELLEKEISLRRASVSELSQLKSEFETIKKQLSQTEDKLRKSETLADNLNKELLIAKATIKEQKKIVAEHTENKIGGEWVSRAEFEKVERELKEKETMIQRFLTIKKEDRNA